MQFLKKYKYYFLAFLIPLVIYTLFFAWKGCFSDKVIANGDMGTQYAPFFQYLKDLLHGNSSFPYTFSKGLGGAMYGTFWYYLACPFNLLFFFFDDIFLFFVLLIIIKLSFCGFTMYVFLENKFKKESASLLIFSIAYSLMSYNIFYHIHVMWFNVVILAPLLLLAIERIIQRKSSTFYIIILFLSIMTNYYIGYMLVLFSILYFGYCFVGEYGGNWKENKKLLFNFLFITFLTGLMTSFILLPSALELFSVNRPNIQTVKFVNFNVIEFITPFYLGLDDSLGYFLFHIFFGTIMLPLIICYFFDSKIKRREKIVTFIMYLFLLLPIFFPMIDRVWHMFTYPINFDYRYSFLATLFSIIICYRSFSDLTVAKKPLKLFLIVTIIFSLSLFITILLNSEYNNFNILKVVLTTLLVIVNIFLLFKKRKAIITFVLFFELLTNLICFGLDHSFVEKKLLPKELQHLQDFSFYCNENKRCETRINYTLNDSLLENYSGVTTFLSTSNSRPLSFLLKSFGVVGVQNYFKYHFDIVLDMLLGVEVVELENNIDEYELLKETSDSYILKNPNALSLGYLVSPNIKNFHSDKLGFLYVEELLNAMDSEEKRYFFKPPLEKINDKEYKLVKKQKYPYLHIYSDPDNVPTINGIELQDEDFVMVGDDYGTIYDKYGDTLIFQFEETPQKFEVYTIDMENISEFKNNRVELEIEENTGNKIVGHVEAKEKSTLFTTIPYEKGWTVKVDGKKVDNYEVIDTFLAIDIEEGYHTITFEYHIPGLTTGVIISILSFLALLFYKRKESTIE